MDPFKRAFEDAMWEIRHPYLSIAAKIIGFMIRIFLIALIFWAVFKVVV